MGEINEHAKVEYENTKSSIGVLLKTKREYQVGVK